MDLNGLQYLVVGAGFFGAVMAERIANDLGQRVLVIDKRNHIGGNSYSAPDPETGIECHCYGSHIFHTAKSNVWEYITRFSEFNSYRHKVLTRYQGRTFSMPINLSTINSLYNLDLTPAEASSFIREESAKAGIINPANLEEKAISLIGRPLYEAFIRGYTIKQWQTDPRDLPESIITRLPVRTGHHYDYFDDRWQGIPWDGYGKLFERMLDNPLIDLQLNTDFLRCVTGCRLAAQ
jgi:UDP-galactopyranose mutase